MRSSLTFVAFIVLSLNVFNLGCQGVGNSAIPINSLNKIQNTSPDQDQGAHGDGDGDADPLPDEPQFPHEDLGICSDLASKGILWSESLNSEDRRAFLLALNISGSFEGHNGWSNLTNNFDKMGLSMGLLNQTLGTGSLQPLLATFRRDFPATYKSLLSSTQKSAMDKMLDAWIAAKGSSGFQKASADEDLFVDEGLDRKPLITADDVDPLQIDKFYTVTTGFKAQDTATSASVTWAVNTIYTPQTGKPNTSWSFKPDWSTALKKIAAHPEYVSLQIKAAEKLHRRALAYQEDLGFYELRGYLMLFDITVQNGSIASGVFTSYFNWLKANPKATLEQQMLKLIDLRAAESNPLYQEDVKSRKKAIVKGTGVVHGSQRNFPAEYCYQPLISYPTLMH